MIVPKLIVTHEVDDVARWLAYPKREEVFASVLTNICTFLDASDPHKVAVSADVADMDAYRAVMNSAAGAAAMTYDGVRPETVKVYVQG